MTKPRSAMVAAAMMFLSVGAALLVRHSQAEDQAVNDSTVSELRTYICLEGRLPALHARFRDHTMKLFEKHGMVNGMYWTPTDGEATALKERLPDEPSPSSTASLGYK